MVKFGGHFTHKQKFWSNIKNFGKIKIQFKNQNCQNSNVSPPFKPALWPTIKVFVAWGASGVDVLNKCLPRLIPGLKYPASAGEALDSITELANSNTTGKKNTTLDTILLESIRNKEVSLQVRIIKTSTHSRTVTKNVKQYVSV